MADAEHVCVYCHSRFIENDGLDDIGCFAAYAGQFYQFFKAIGDLTFKVFHQHLGHAYKVLGLVVGIGHAADILVYHVGSSSGECFGSREVPVKGRGNHIDAFVRTLCRENNCYQQLERIVIMQLCFGYGNVLPKPSKDFS